MLLNDWWPWTAHDVYVKDCRGEIVAHCVSKDHARMIAEAPSMLRKLQGTASKDLNDRSASHFDHDEVRGRAEGVLS